MLKSGIWFYGFVLIKLIMLIVLIVSTVLLLFYIKPQSHTPMKLLKNILCVLCASVLVFHAKAQYKIEVLDSNTFTLGEGVVLHKTSFRGLSVVDDQTIWVSGSRGTIAKSVDGGKTFTYTQLKWYEKSDFRDIEAFDDKRAIIMSSGTPAYILKTTDGGQTWKEVYKNTDTAYFLDAMDFWDDKRGVIVGDPIAEHFVLLRTIDGGETWNELDTAYTPWAFRGESIFAASGNSLRCINIYDEEGAVNFVTGGEEARLIMCNIFSQYVDVSRRLAIQKGKNAKGAFSLAVDLKGGKVIIVGGDYSDDTLVQINSCMYNRFEDDMYIPYDDQFYEKLSDRFKYPNRSMKNDVFGYRSSVEAIKNNLFIACGTNGVDLLKRKKWKPVDKEPFHVVRKAKKGKAVFLAGPNGKIGKLIY